MREYSVSDVSAVVCTLNSIKSVGACLQSLRQAGVGEILVVDAGSKDGSREVADALADQVVEDEGIGLGHARNLGIAKSTKALILNAGSDNVFTKEALETMVDTLTEQDLHGVGARTRLTGTSYLDRSLNLWWETRMRPGPVTVIGTPSLFLGELLRSEPFSAARAHSDDSEICERWARKYDARFAISSACVDEVGKNDWTELASRFRNYGVSDYEIFVNGQAIGWTLRRKIKSLLHPITVDFVQPVLRSSLPSAVEAAPVLLSLTTLRYASWLREALKLNK